MFSAQEGLKEFNLNSYTMINLGLSKRNQQHIADRGLRFICFSYPQAVSSSKLVPRCTYLGTAAAAKRVASGVSLRLRLLLPPPHSLLQLLHRLQSLTRQSMQKLPQASHTWLEEKISKGLLLFHGPARLTTIGGG